MFKKLHLILTVLLIAVSVYAVPTSSAWDHSGSELTSSPTIVPGVSPIQYTSAFTREREIYGYNPRFMPLPVVFDKDNRPYILTAVPDGDTVGSNRSSTNGTDVTDNAFIQTIDDSGNWVTYSIMGIMDEIYGQGSPYYNPSITAGYKWEDRIFFDDDNNLYFTMISESPDVSGTVIVYSDDDKQSWKSLHLNYIYNTSVETFDTFSSVEKGMPSISHYKADGADRLISLCELAKDPTGILQFDETKAIVDATGKFGPGHSGYLNYTMTIGDRIHFFWLDKINQAPDEETMQYTCYYDKTTETISTPVFLGSTFGNWYGDPPSVTVDPHNGPTVTVDRNKTIHVVLGGHGSQAKYTYSTDQGDTWAVVTDLPGENFKNTYPTLITDREGTVHLVYRASMDTDDYRLSYSRKKAGQAWEDMGALVVPGNDGYSIYYHTMTVDRLGRLFLQYYYRADLMSEADKAEYIAKWPSEPDPDTLIYTHDPAMIMTDNGGDSWKIATTQDFVDGLIDDTKPVVCCLFDTSGNIGQDMAGYDNNLNEVAGNPASVNGVIGNAVNFAGSADSLTGSLVQATELTDGTFSVVGWFKLNASPSSASVLVSANAGNSGFDVSVNDGQWILTTYATGYSDTAVASSATTAGQWVHLAFTFEPVSADGTTYTGTSKVYIDGVLVAEVANRKFDTSAADSLTIGGEIGLAIDEFGVFTGAMPVQKIVELADNSFRPSNVSRELIYKGDINGDGLVNTSDLSIFAASWLNAD